MLKVNSKYKFKRKLGKSEIKEEEEERTKVNKEEGFRDRFHHHFMSSFFCTKVFCAALMRLQFGFVTFWRKEIGAKAARKMLVKLAIGLFKFCRWLREMRRMRRTSAFNFLFRSLPFDKYRWPSLFVDFWLFADKKTGEDCIWKDKYRPWMPALVFVSCNFLRMWPPRIVRETCNPLTSLKLFCQMPFQNNNCNSVKNSTENHRETCRNYMTSAFWKEIFLSKMQPRMVSFYSG